MSGELSGKDRRLHPRAEGEFAVIFNLTLPIPVNMDAGGEEYPAVALDVSEGGIGLDVDRSIPVGAPVKIRFELINRVTTIEDFRMRFFKLDGQVRYCGELKRQHFHAGIQFSSISPEERAFILNYIADYNTQKQS